MTRGDVVFAGVCLAVTLVGGSIGVALFPRAFPEASIDFRVTREEAVSVARKELTARGFDLAGTKALVVFDHDDDAKVYLERTLGLKTAGPLFGREVPVWRWAVRFVRPLKALEYAAWVDPAGKVIALRRILPEKEAAPDAGDEAARALAARTLNETFGVAAEGAGVRFVEGTSEKRPARVDRTYTWESTTLRHGDGALRWLVEVQGDRVGRVKAFYKVPDKWREAYGKLRSRNMAAGSVATLGMLVTALGLLGSFVARVRRRDVKWRWALAFGGVGAVLQLLSTLNELPVTLWDYNTADTWGSVVAKAILGGTGVAVLLGAVLVLMVAGGEPLYREAYRDKPALGRILSRAGVGSRPFFRGVLLGYALTGFFFAYQVLFYVAAEKAGAWAPADIPYSNLLGTSFPWLAVLLMGFMPATTEEFLSRMFSIPWFRRFLPLWAAVLVPAFIWGFGHAGYPNQPFWIRGVEVGVAGVLIGVVMLKADLFPLLVWHFTVDAVYTSLILVRSSNPYFVASGALAAGALLLPLFVSLVLYARRGGFAPSAALTNGAVGSAPPPPESAATGPVAVRGPAAVAPRVLAAFGVIAAGALALGALLPRFALEKEPYALSRAEALSRAGKFVRERGDEPGRYWKAAFAAAALPSLDGSNDAGEGLVPYDWSRDAERWLLEHGGKPALARWGTKVLPGAVWQVRFVRLGDRHGWWVSLDGKTGRVVGWRRSLPEEEKGASLAPDVARARAEEALALAGYDPSSFSVVSSKAVDQKERRDYRIVFESAREAAGEARLRASVGVQGDSVGAVGVGLKLPEDWLRARERSTPAYYFAIGWKVIGIGTLVGLFLFELVRKARQGGVPWRAAALAGLAPLVVVLASLSVSWPVFLRNLPGLDMLTEGTFTVTVGVGVAAQLLFVWGASLVAIAMVLAVRPDALEALRARRWDGRRSVVAAALAAGLVFGARLVRVALATAFPIQAGLGPDGGPPAIDTLFPALPPLWSSVQATLVWGAIAALSVLLLRDVLARPVARFVTAIALAGVFVPGSAHTLGEIFVPLAGALLPVTAMLAALWWLVGDDPPALLLLVFLLNAGNAGVRLVLSGVTAWVLPGALLLAAALALALRLASRRPAHPPGSGLES